MIDALEALKAIPQWVCYKNEIKADGEKPAKMPKNPHFGGNASSTNSETWGTFLDAVRAKKRYNMTGLGWVFTEEAGIIGIDLDDCIDEAGQVEAWSREIVDDLHSYTEISPSGRGLHIFVYGQIPKALGPAPGRKIEMYSRARYFTMTGDMLPGSFEKIAHRQAALDKLWKAENEYRRPESKPAPQSTSSTPPVNQPDKLKAYTEKAYLDEMTTLSMATSGCRNDMLNRAAFNLGQFIEAGLLAQTEIEITLFNLAIQLGLSEREANATIQSGIKAGVANPRNNWPEDKPPNDADQKNERLPRNDLTYHEQIGPHIEFVFNQWGLTERTIEEFKMGYCYMCPTSPYSPSFTIPYYQADKLLDIRHRLLSPNGQGIYRPEIEGYPAHLFNIAAVQDDVDDWAILVNREFNTMLLHQNFLPVIGLPSTFKKEWVAQLKNLNRVYVALNPGQDFAAKKIGLLLTGESIDARICSLPFSPRDMLIQYGCSLDEFWKFVEQGWGM
jgi:hypothetical protein